MAQAKFEVESAPEQEGYVPAQDAEREGVFEAFRRWGYLQADLDPLGLFRPQPHPELQLSGPAAEEARRYYCGSIGAEFAHIADPERRRWIERRMESSAPAPDQQYILERLIRADLFEQVMQSRYLGSKRFSLEGLTVLIPLLDELLEGAAERGAEQAVLGMSHRGRLNVIVHIVGRAPAEIFANFEDVDPRSVLGGGDVKYHLGATGVYTSEHGRNINIHLVSNPSHLEAVDPVVLGRVRAKQVRFGERGAARFLPILIHGDGAFAGQGIWAETLNFAGVNGYSVGGALHIIANNLIGFTTTPPELHTSQFSAQLARRQDIPIFHANAEDPDAVMRVARMALEYRYEFGSDVVIDVIGYRRHGHSEIDDPTITQPLLYKAIEQHPPLWQIYAEDIGADASAQAEQVRAEYDLGQKEAKGLTKKPSLRRLPDYWAKFTGGRYKPEYEVDTGLPAEEIAALTEKLTTYPADFHIHPKIKRLLQQRVEMGTGKRAVDYGMAEALAFASLLKQGTPVRMSGQDTQRGTFNQRHAVLVDVENESRYIPLCHVSQEQGRFEIYNSTLSEAGPLGFEYGYSRDYPETLVLWEAQFGDFANGGQVVIDQFISSGEDKWGLLSGLVMLLPHGYEGQGPEHSSGRIERYLQLAAKDNIQVAQPSTAAQYFHLLRRQALRNWRKPLIVFTPKGMLRHPDAASPLSQLTEGSFQTVIQDHEIANGERILVCSGKIGHELRRERKRRGDTKTAIIFLEQLFPLPETELEAAFAQHTSAREFLWVQEEPANMGALNFLAPQLERLARGAPFRSVKRSPSSSPSTGSHTAHEMEQKTLLELAFKAF